MKTKRHILETLAMLLALCLVFTLVLRNGGTASGYPAGPTPTPSNPQGLVPRAYLPVVLNPPPYTTSHYMNKAATPYDPYSLGSSDAAIQDFYLSRGLSLVTVLDFGQPCSGLSGGTTFYGAFGFDNTCHSTAEFKSDAANYISGYCTYLAGQHAGIPCGYTPLYPLIRIAIGTNNCTNGASGCHNIPGDTNVTSQNGQAFAQIVNDLDNNFLVQNAYGSVVQVIGALDIELSWNNPTHTLNWLNGFGSVAPAVRMYNYGDCECSLGYNPTVVLTNSWAYHDIWWMSWGSNTFNPYPLPEIYNTTGANAYQWQGVSHYGKVSETGPMIFVGLMTQMQACVQKGGCPGVDDSPDQGLSQLKQAISQDPLIAYSLPSYLSSTDIHWYPHP